MHGEICSHLDRLLQKINSERCFGDMQAKTWIPATKTYLNNVADEIMFEMAENRNPISLTENLQTGSTPRGSKQENEKKEIKIPGTTENDEICKLKN